MSLFEITLRQPASLRATFAGLTIPARPSRKWVSRHRATAPAQALQRALERHWGRRARWFADSGLGVSYGQVIVPSDAGGSLCVTERVRLRVIEVRTGRDLTERAVSGVES